VNEGSHAARVKVFDRYTGKTSQLVLDPEESSSKHWSLTRFFGWYDFRVTVDEDPGFASHLAGHVETGEDSMSDPAMGGLV
jgi:phospholipase C